MEWGQRECFLSFTISLKEGGIRKGRDVTFLLIVPAELGESEWS